MFAEVTRTARTTRSLADLGVEFDSGKNVVDTDLAAIATHRVIKVSAVSSEGYIPAETKPLPAD